MTLLLEGAWAHPKVTPYRLVVMLTTMELGVAKAVLVSRNQTVSSITIEWIAGVVLALVFQLVGSYEYSGRRPQYLAWFFQFDCFVPSTWVVEGRQGSTQIHSELPPMVTAYRLVVSGAFVVFGLGKMLCGYIGRSAAMNTLDWIITVPLTVGLYYIGLYEENGCSAPRKLFDVDYSAQTNRALWIGLFLTAYFGGITLCTFWIRYWMGPLITILKEQEVRPDISSPSQWENSAWNVVFDHAVKWTAVSFCIAMLEIGVLSIGVALWPIFKACIGKRATAVRYYILLVSLLIVSLLIFLLCIYLFLISFSVTVPMSIYFINSPPDPDVSLPLRMVLPLVMAGSTVITGVPAVFVAIKFTAVLRLFRRTFSKNV